MSLHDPTTYGTYYHVAAKVDKTEQPPAEEEGSVQASDTRIPVCTALSCISSNVHRFEMCLALRRYNDRMPVRQ